MSLNISMPSLASIGSTIVALPGNIAKGICSFGRMVRKHTTGRLLETSVNRAIRDNKHEKVIEPLVTRINQGKVEVLQNASTRYHLKDASGETLRERRFSEYCLDRALKPLLQLFMNAEAPSTTTAV